MLKTGFIYGRRKGLWSDFIGFHRILLVLKRVSETQNNHNTHHINASYDSKSMVKGSGGAILAPASKGKHCTNQWVTIQLIKSNCRRNNLIVWELNWDIKFRACEFMPSQSIYKKTKIKSWLRTCFILSLLAFSWTDQSVCSRQTILTRPRGTSDWLIGLALH